VDFSSIKDVMTITSQHYMKKEQITCKLTFIKYIRNVPSEKLRIYRFRAHGLIHRYFQLTQLRVSALNGSLRASGCLIFSDPTSSVVEVNALVAFSILLSEDSKKALGVALE
jgi:hypothetical protein